MIPTVSFAEARRVFVGAPVDMPNRALADDCTHELYVGPVVSFCLDLYCSKCYGALCTQFTPKLAGLPFEDAVQSCAEGLDGEVKGAMAFTLSDDMTGSFGVATE
jgi:hypothetical protein